MNNGKRMPKAEAGFTLIEIMVVVIIIGLLSAMVVPNLFDKQTKAFQVKAGNDIRQVSGQLELYRLETFSFPNTSEGLGVLVSTPGYLKKLPKDPWKKEYQYQYPGTRNPNGYDLWSFGSDGVAGGEGAAKDIGNWEETN